MAIHSSSSAVNHQKIKSQTPAIFSHSSLPQIPLILKMLLSHPIIFFTTAFGAVSMANPIANAEAAALAILDDLPEWESYSTSLEARNAEPAGLEARQGGPIACIATV
jgi:hypothetical protein